MAHGYEFPNLGSLRPNQFSGGEQTFARKLRELGFNVERTSESRNEGFVSALLAEGSVYTREQLKTILKSGDATINTGVFRPANFASILVFITPGALRVDEGHRVAAQQPAPSFAHGDKALGPCDKCRR